MVRNFNDCYPTVKLFFFDDSLGDRQENLKHFAAIIENYHYFGVLPLVLPAWQASQSHIQLNTDDTIRHQIFLSLLPNNVHHKFHKIQDDGQECLLL